MEDRTDALAAASEFVLDVEAAANDVVATDSDSAVGTVGSLSVSPNATNVVPGRVEAGVDVRDVETESMETIVAAARESLARLERERARRDCLRATLQRDADADERQVPRRGARGGRGGGTDRSISTPAPPPTRCGWRRFADSARPVFAPSQDGISHSPREWTDWADCAAATEVLAGAGAGG